MIEHKSNTNHNISVDNSGGHDGGGGAGCSGVGCGVGRSDGDGGGSDKIFLCDKKWRRTKMRKEGCNCIRYRINYVFK